MRPLLLGLAWLILSAASAPGAQSQPLPPTARAALLEAPSLRPVVAQMLRETPASRDGLDTIPPPDRWLAMDKAKHLGGSFFVVLGGQYVFEEKAALRRGPALALSLSTGAIVGLGKELYDWRLGPSRHFSTKDLAADALGLLLAAGVVVL